VDAGSDIRPDGRLLSEPRNAPECEFRVTKRQLEFTGDGHLSSAPIVIGQVVFVGSTSGDLYALDASTGVQLWGVLIGSAISAPDESGVSTPLTGLGAGEGYLVVPAGSAVTAWHLVPH
jgi:outer membrane protein assembly factor BamB